MRSFLSIAFLSLLTCLNISAQSIVVNSALENEFSFELTFNQENFHFEKVNVRDAEFLSFQVNQLAKSLDIGNPDLPVYSKLIEVPEEGEINYNIVGTTEKEIDLLELGFHQEILPAQRSISKSEDQNEVVFEYNASTYLKDAFYSQSRVSIERLGKMRGKSIARIQINPFEYHPLTNTIRYTENIELELTFTSSIKPLDKAFYSNEFESNFSKLLNSSTLSKEDFSAGNVTRMIILSDSSFESELQDFIAWKRRKGIDVIEVYKGDSGVGTTYESMKAYVQSIYESATDEEPAPTYLLIVGDHEQIPSYNTGAHVADMYYCEFDGGGDFFPEMFYGRFSANNSAELQSQIDKTLQYEQYTMSDPSYLDEILLVAGVDASYAPTYGNGQINYGTDYYFNSAHDLTTYAYLYPESGSSASAIINNVSSGVGFANYTAHCSPSGWADPSFSVYDVDGLQNEDQYGLLVGNCCQSNQFNGYTCFGEALLRASKKGAIGYIGGSNNTYWNEDYYWGVGSGPISANPTYNETSQAAYDCSFHENGESEEMWATTQAQLMHAGNWAVSESGGSDQYYWEIYHLMGDPSVMNYYGVPSILSISHPSALPLGTNSISVNTEQHTYVAVNQGGELLAASYSDASGYVQLDFPALTSIEAIEIVATKQNKQPYIGEIMIMSSDAPFVSVTGLDISDYDNNLAEPGESVEANISLQNFGMEYASEVNMTVNSLHPGVSISNVSGNIGYVAADELINISDAFTITLDNTLSDLEVVVVDFILSDSSGNEWESSQSFVVHAPLIELTSVESSLVFGESTLLSITLTNNGSSDFMGGSLMLSSLSSYLTIESNPNVSELAVGESISLTYEVYLESDATSSTNIDLLLSINSDSYNQTSEFVIQTPMCQSTDLNVVITINTDNWGYETSWNISNSDGVELASISGSYDNNTSYETLICAAEGTQLNFNIEDSYGDGIYSPNGYWITVCGNEVAQGDTFGSGASETFVVTCDVFVEILGCMDSEADNYNSEANADDGSCVYTIDCESATALQLIMADSYGDGWNGNYFELYDIDGNQLVNTTLESGSSGTYDFCLNDGCYSIVTTNAGSWTSEVSWSLVDATGANLATGLSPSSTSISLNQDCGFVNGCTDASACNYNMDANVDDGSCSYAAAYYDCDGNCISDVDGDGFCDELEIYGCMDQTASNYNPNATEEDGSCLEPVDCEGLTTVLIEVGGGSWESEVSWSLGAFEGIVGTMEACLEDGCHTFNMIDSYGDGWNGNTVTITLSNGDVLLSGTLESGYEGSLDFGLNTTETCGDITIVYGCMDTSATNYNAEATIDDGSCIYMVYGCTDAAAINYNAEATEDDGSCEYAVDCEGLTNVTISMLDSYGDGWNGNVLTINNQDFTIDSGSEGFGTACIDLSLECIAVTCDGGSWQSEVSWTISEGDAIFLSGGAPYSGGIGDCGGSTDVYGCTDAAALNYNSEANTDDGSCEYEQTVGPWEVLITGSNHTIAVGGDTPITIEDMPIENGDWIGVFYTDDNGDLQCAGYAEWNSETTAIAAQGDDSTTDEIDGLQTGETFVWMIWDASEDVIYSANASYLAGMPSGSDFVINGITGLESLHTAPEVSEQIIELPQGWSLFSTYMLTDNMDVVEMLTAINSEIVIVKDNAGLAYLPEWGFNGIGDMIVGQGYQIKLTSASTLIVEGQYMEPEENPITLTEGWNMFGCLRLQGSDVSSVFADIVDDVVIVKNGEGLAYLPEWGFNGIGNIEPGQGYQAKMNTTQILNYLPNDQEYRLSEVLVVDNSSLNHYSMVKSTGNNMTILIEDEAWDKLPIQESEIAVLDKYSTIIGSATYTSPITVVTVWGDDLTTLIKDGLAISEEVSFKLWSPEGVCDFTVSEWKVGSSDYYVDGINIAGTIETCNDLTTPNATERKLLRVIDVLGRDIGSNSHTFNGKVIFKVYDDGTVEKIVL